MIIDSRETMYLYFFVICMGQRPYVIIKNIISVTVNIKLDIVLEQIYK